MRAASREPKPARDYFFLAFGLNEIPSRLAIFLIVSGGRPIAFAASSNDFEARANSINCRCSLNDQAAFRTMMECVLLSAQSRQAEYIGLTTSPWVGPDLGKLSGPPSIFDLGKFA